MTLNELIEELKRYSDSFGEYEVTVGVMCSRDIKVNVHNSSVNINSCEDYDIFEMIEDALGDIDSADIHLVDNEIEDARDLIGYSKDTLERALYGF